MIEPHKTDPSDFELMLARAFDLGWEEFVRIEGQVANTAENRGSLAARIVVLARLGESDETKLGLASLIYLRALFAAKRLVQDDRSNPHEESLSAAPTLDQAGINAAAAALDACLEELPEGLSGTARSVLSKAIIEKAGNGMRDMDDLKHFALQALRSRL